MSGSMWKYVEEVNQNMDVFSFGKPLWRVSIVKSSLSTRSTQTMQSWLSVFVVKEFGVRHCLLAEAVVVKNPPLRTPSHRQWWTLAIINIRPVLLAIICPHQSIILPLSSILPVQYFVPFPIWPAASEATSAIQIVFYNYPTTILGKTPFGNMLLIFGFNRPIRQLLCWWCCLAWWWLCVFVCVCLFCH